MEQNNTALYVLGLVGVAVLVGGIWWFMQSEEPIAEPITEPVEELFGEDEMFEMHDEEEFMNPAGIDDAPDGALLPPAPDEASMAPGVSQDDNDTAVASHSEELEPVVIDMESGMFFFEPNVIRAQVGQPVVVNVTATGVHDFVIDEFSVRQATPDGETTTIEFTPTRAGSFEFYCSIGSHRERGQVGTLIVE